MQTNHTARLASLALAFGALIATTATFATAAPTSWDVPAGDHGTYTYTGGQTLNNNFGSGTAIASGFFFSPDGIVATANTGFDTFAPTSSSASDTISVILNAKPLTQFGSVSTTIFGDYSTDDFSFVNATGTLRVYNLDNLAAGPAMMDLDFGNSFGNIGNLPTLFADSQGKFIGTAALALPPGWSNIRVELDGLVSADAVIGSSAIQAKDVGLDIETAPLSNTTTEVPLPAAVFAVPVVAAVALKMRRKLIKR